MAEFVYLFTDGSVDVRSKIGWGAYLAINDLDRSPAFQLLRKQVRVRKFINTSSSKLEIQTLLWALEESYAATTMVYTDSQNIIGLPGRRERLESLDFHARSGRLLKNHELYRNFYKIAETRKLILHQVKGHSPTSHKNQIEKIFSLVDRASREALRNDE